VSGLVVGRFLFRWRSYLPIALLVPLLTALPASGWFEAAFGEEAETAWDVFAALVAFLGLGVRIATIGFAPAGTSGRNTRAQRAETLNTTGLYAVVRNPLYLGNAIIVLGLALSVKVWWMVPLALAGTWAFYAQVVRAEEAFLTERFGVVYERWKAVTPAFLPRFHPLDAARSRVLAAQRAQARV
jgi:protein-S-isoprenylcysteine O-methyltransferase Ste14